tara:strand:+ start:264 stop:572 length:309 start_codon:yes stop_codon:yes gene_type:complete
MAKKCPKCGKSLTKDSRGRSRCYNCEYDRDHKGKKDKKDRASRNAARKKVSDWYKAHGKKLSKDKDVDHKDGNPQNNSSGNLRTQSKKENRGRSNKERANKS